MSLGENSEGNIGVKNFGVAYNSLIIIPSLQSKTSGFNGLELAYPYTFTVSITKENQEDQALIQQLLAQIESLKKQIAQLQGSPNPGASTCSQIINNLYIGLSNNSEVMCLQAFLKSQGADIYPEGLVTGKFGSFTKAAVIRFQERYRSEVLVPAGLPSGTGYVGALTRAKINSLLR